MDDFLDEKMLVISCLCTYLLALLEEDIALSSSLNEDPFERDEPDFLFGSSTTSTPSNFGIPPRSARFNCGPYNTNSSRVSVI